LLSDYGQKCVDVSSSTARVRADRADVRGNGEKTAQEPAPKPGQPGVAIIAGHVDSEAAGRGAHYGLKDLKIGDAVQVIGSDGHACIWTVTASPEMTRKTALPSSLFVTTGPPRLALVTCGGAFNAATGHYPDNVIVRAAPSRKG
jgi:hypothetical protein